MTYSDANNRSTIDRRGTLYKNLFGKHYPAWSYVVEAFTTAGHGQHAQSHLAEPGVEDVWLLATRSRLYLLLLSLGQLTGLMRAGAEWASERTQCTNRIYNILFAIQVMQHDYQLPIALL